MNESELRAEIERLTELNDQLSKQLIGMSDNLQSSARQIAADAWDAGHESGFWNGRESAGNVEGLLIGAEHAAARNPFRKPLDLLGGDE